MLRNFRLSFTAWPMNNFFAKWAGIPGLMIYND